MTFKLQEIMKSDNKQSTIHFYQLCNSFWTSLKHQFSQSSVSARFAIIQSDLADSWSNSPLMTNLVLFDCNSFWTMNILEKSIFLTVAARFAIILSVAHSPTLSNSLASKMELSFMMMRSPKNLANIWSLVTFEEKWRQHHIKHEKS